MKPFICLLLCLLACLVRPARAQELNCKVSINHAQIQGTNTQVFATLENALKEFVNERKWTNAQYAANERIACTMNITVKKYSDDGAFECELIVQSNRPVFNASYNTVLFNFKDVNFNFNYLEYDPLEWKDNIVDNNLTAVIAYYAYLIIGLDMDSMAPMGGTDVLHIAENIVSSAQMLGETGWKAFDDSRNRHALVSDYMDGSMKPLRQLMYDYHRLGLDEMAQNADRGRARITESLALLKEAKAAKSMSALPQIWVDAKKDELVNIYTKGTQNERDGVYDLLMEISPSQSTDWDKIKSAKP
ncbi:MAG: DUF4835 family protein [Bacteroidaceae bacterium]